MKRSSVIHVVLLYLLHQLSPQRRHFFTILENSGEPIWSGSRNVTRIQYWLTCATVNGYGGNSMFQQVRMTTAFKVSVSKIVLFFHSPITYSVSYNTVFSVTMISLLVMSFYQ